MTKIMQMQSNFTEKDKNQEKSNFLLLTEMMILIHIHMEIKPIQTSEIDDQMHFLDFVDLKVIFDSSHDD